MKRVLILVLLFSCSFISFAKDYDEMKSDIGGKSANASGSGSVEKLLLYESYKQNALIPFLLNLFVGFGIGSFVQGDLAGGFLILGFDALGLGLMGGGIYSVSQHKSKDLPVLGFSLIALGGVTMFLTRIAEVIIPFTYANNYNKRLQENLGIALGGFQPEVDLSFDGNSGVVFELSFTKKY
ncbi:P13 family porin [Borrelia persica]|uniref:P13 family porin n=1 Tax=Borrelia persica TaxID=44448 RepID=UPI000467B78F|nr:P13 family porin [Borrelia persica]